jgi:hypothetical protein
MPLRTIDNYLRPWVWPNTRPQEWKTSVNVKGKERTLVREEALLEGTVNRNIIFYKFIIIIIIIL